jgi:GDPmannose 4,6-dehydratase
VRVSFDEPEFTSDVIANGTLRLLEALRALSPSVRTYIAGSSEMFGSSPPPQNESTPFRPRSPYGAAKVAAHEYARVYRESYGMWIARGILHNHESETRGETFVTRKITRAATRISLGLQNTLYLGNLDARRDWGHAQDYVAAMWLMLQHSEPDDFVIATGESHTVREFAERAFERVGLTAAHHIIHDTRYERPAEVDALEGDASKARRVLGWKPRVTFDELVNRMVDSDMELAEREKLSRGWKH